jgi:hypothetical protein
VRNGGRCVLRFLGLVRTGTVPLERWEPASSVGTVGTLHSLCVFELLLHFLPFVAASVGALRRLLAFVPRFPSVVPTLLPLSQD